MAVLTTSLAVKAQSTKKSTPPENKIEYVFAWGLFKSNDYPKDKSVESELEKPELSASKDKQGFDSTKYEQKSILWGAIQWTEKKDNVTPVKSQNIGK